MKKQKQETNRPTHGVYMVQDGAEGEKGFWTKIGAAWLHKDDRGANIVLDCIPLSGRLVVRELSEKEADGENKGAQQ